MKILTNLVIQDIMIFMQMVKFVKSFSRGQVTIPKDIRESLGVSEDFWMKMTVEDGKLVVEPIKNTVTKEDYLKKLLSMKTDWFDKEAEEDMKKVRKELDEHASKNSL
jgi:antitoxin PrlF